VPAKLHLASLGLVAAVFLAGLSMRSWRSALPVAPAPDVPDLSHLVSAQIPGFKVAELPIATSYEQQKVVNELLNYDDALYRLYKRGEFEISVYIAYWRPGKMPQRLIAGHTPDICWVNNGWQRIGILSPTLRTSSGYKLASGRARSYRKDHDVQHVIFWHLVGGKPAGYSDRDIPPWWAIFADMWHDGIEQKAEQVFLRVSSPAGIDATLDSPVFDELAKALGRFGLVIPPEK
jgi:hypothetical protein